MITDLEIEEFVEWLLDDEDTRIEIDENSPRQIEKMVYQTAIDYFGEAISDQAMEKILKVIG